MNLVDNTMLITGGTSGIGRALAQAFHRRGNKVIIAGRREDRLREITKANPGMAYIQLDVTDKRSIAGAASHISSEFPTLNVLFANAGISRPENYAGDHIETDTAEALLETNVLSVIRLTAALLPVLKRQPIATLMATSSGLGFVPLPSYPTYSATKAFVHAWLEAIRFQLRHSKIEVLELIPPYVQTELGGDYSAKDPRAMPLKAFIDEVMTILEQGTHDKGEIVVQKAMPYRWAEKNGTYNDFLNQLGSF